MKELQEAFDLIEQEIIVISKFSGNALMINVIFEYLKELLINEGIQLK